MAEDEQFNQAFGEHTGIDEEVRVYINSIKDNVSDVYELMLRSDEIDGFTDLAWTLFGRYVANNTHLTKLDLEECSLSDEQIISLFSELTSSKSLDRLDLDGNDFGIDGVRSIIPLLQNSPQFTSLWLAGNRRIDSECFEVLVSALNGTSFKELYFYSCNITDISVLGRHNLPNLHTLNLDENKIGRGGCITLANILQRDDTRLKNLYLDNTSIDDEGVEILATSLKHNTALESLSLQQNSITKKGCNALLKVLVDVSSIENTYNSNHTLTKLQTGSSNKVIKQIDSAIDINNNSSTYRAAGRAKVIKYQLDSQKRMELCQLQGIEYSSIGNIFADIEVNLLPKILALIGEKHGQSQLYTALLPTAPDLMSFIDRKAMLKDERARKAVQMKELTRQLAVLAAEDDQLNKRLVLIELGDTKQAAMDGGEGSGWEKRQRIN